MYSQNVLGKIDAADKQVSQTLFSFFWHWLGYLQFPTWPHFVAVALAARQADLES